MPQSGLVHGLLLFAAGVLAGCSPVWLLQYCLNILAILPPATCRIRLNTGTVIRCC
jgi:hypothetical protein